MILSLKYIKIAQGNRSLGKYADLFWIERWNARPRESETERERAREKVKMIVIQ